MNNSHWEKSRKAYLEYRDAKRKLNTLNKACGRAHRNLKSAFSRYTTTHARALTHFEIDYSKELTNAYRTLREANLHSDACQKDFDRNIRQFRDKEIDYSIVIFRGLIKRFGLAIKDISEIYGIWSSNISKWIGKGKSKELLRIYEKEYGIDEKEEG